MEKLIVGLKNGTSIEFEIPKESNAKAYYQRVKTSVSIRVIREYNLEDKSIDENGDTFITRFSNYLLDNQSDIDNISLMIVNNATVMKTVPVDPIATFIGYHMQTSDSEFRNGAETLNIQTVIVPQ